MFRNLLFYTVSGTIITLVAQVLGVGLGVTLFAALVGPPTVLIAWVLYRNRGGVP